MNYKPNHFTPEEQALIFKAIRFAANKHDGHWRKGTAIPYISHLMNVMKILCEHRCPAPVVVAGILHDTVEDTPVTVQDIVAEFGEDVSKLVVAATEADKLEEAAQRKKDKTGDWRSRKQKTIDHIAHESDFRYLLVSAADKLDNIRSIRADYEALGDTLWQRFNAGKIDQQWYYNSLAQTFVQRGNEAGDPLKTIANEMALEVKRVFGESE
jgi:(p)ppGpp synthase/HD superfamily hydrolase